MEKSGRHASTMSTYFSTLDSGTLSANLQENDFTHTQLRLVREQTANCIKDLNALRTEVLLLKAEQKSDRLNASSLANSMEGKQVEVQEHFEREKRERAVVLQQLSTKVQSLERELPSMRDEMSLMREQLRSLETSCQPHFQDLHSTFLKDVEARHQAHGELEQLAELGAGTSRHSATHKDLHDLQTSVQQEQEKLDREFQKHVAKASEMQERLLYLEKLMGDSAASHARDLAAAHQKIQDHSFQSMGHAEEQKARQISLASRVEFLEKSLGDSAAKHGQELLSAHQKITDLHGLSEHSERKHSSLQERVDFIENLLGDNAQKHSEELKKTQDRLSELRGKLGVGMPVSSSEKQVTVESRLKYLEQALGDSDAKHQEELKHAHEKLETLHGRLGSLEVKGATVDKLKHHCEKQGTALEDLKSSHANLSSDKSELDLHHATLKERVDYLESMMGDSADRNKKVHEEHKANHAKLSNELRVREASHATLADRMSYIEQQMGDSFEKHAKELAAAVAKTDAMLLKVAREAHTASLDTLKKAHGSLASEKQALEKHHATLADRVDYLEKVLGDSSDKHTRELEALKVAHQKMLAEHKGQEQGHGQVADRVTQLQKEKEDLRAHHMSLAERIDYLEKLLGESAEKHAQELEKVKDKHAKLDSGANKLRSHHAGLEERMEYLEGKIGDSADLHAKELSNVHAKMEELHGKLRIAEEKHGEERHASLEERLKLLESLMGDNADGKESHQTVKVLEEKHAGVLERLESVEKAQAARQKIEETLKCKSQEQQKHNETQAELVDSLQRTVGIFDALIRKDMEERKSEMKRLWDAIDGHTHDLSSKIKAVGSDAEDGEEERSLRPSRFSLSSPALRNASTTLGRPVATSSRIVTYRPTVFPTAQARVVSYPTTVVQAPAPPVLISKPEPGEGSTQAGRSLSPSRHKDHSEVVCGKARYGPERAHNAEIPL